MLDGWSIRNTPDIVFDLDPDDIVRAYIEIIEHDRDVSKDFISSILDLFDVDRCPFEFLPALGERVGLTLFENDLIDFVQPFFEYVENDPDENASSMFGITGWDRALNPTLYFAHQIDFTVSGRKIHIYESEEDRAEANGNMFGYAEVSVGVVSVVEQNSSGFGGKFIVDNIPENGATWEVTATLVNGVERAWRAQIRSAVPFYREKGLRDSFTLVFRSLGLAANIFPLWIDVNGNVERFPIDSSWKPHARLDIDIQGYGNLTKVLENFGRMIEKIEEVRPAHVLFRQLNPGFVVSDIMDINSEGDALTGTLTFSPTDNFMTALLEAQCGIYHFETPRLGINHDGGGFNWIYPYTLDRITTPPGSPSTGNRYIVAPGGTGLWLGRDNNIAEWDGSFWAFTVPVDLDATWVQAGTPPDFDEETPGDWRAWTYDGNIWTEAFELYDVPRAAPGPFFRECEGIPGGISNELEIWITDHVGGGPPFLSSVKTSI